MQDYFVVVVVVVVGPNGYFWEKISNKYSNIIRIFLNDVKLAIT
jgi:hypothetical protein